MKATPIFTPYQSTAYSKTFRVDPGFAIVVSTFNFSQGKHDATGEELAPGDCAILHKVDMSGDRLEQFSDCRKCMNGVIEGLKSHILKSEPVLVDGCAWSLNADNNLLVLSVPGYYMFEFCNKDNFGQAVIQIEELSAADAAIIPRPLFYGET